MKDSPTTLIIKPDRGLLSLELKELWDYRDLLYLLVWRDIKGRYRQMALGPLWIVLQPLMTILVFSLVFGKFVQVPSDGLPYPVFAYTALLPWQLFATATTKSADSLVNNIHLVSKIYFPRMIVPVAAVFVSLADFGFSFGILLLMMVCYGIFPNWAVITLPFYLLLAVATALGVGLWLASLSVKFRDVQIAVTYLIQLWFYATPVIYPTSLVPQQWQFFYRLNPMTQVIEGFRWGLLGTGQLPDVTLIISLLLVVGLVLSGAFYFRQTEGSIADSL